MVPCAVTEGTVKFCAIDAQKLAASGRLDLLRKTAHSIWAPDALIIGAHFVSSALTNSPVVWGVLPQVAPLWTSYALYRFESNARSATVLGLIGAGGIGQLLFDSLNAFAYREVSAIAVIIIVAVSLIDLLSQAMRSRLL